jgi:SAM-dependent methyltransferase
VSEKVASGQARRGLRWRLTGWVTRRSRAARYRRFLDVMTPTAEMTLLDVGVTASPWRDGNFLEARYPWPNRIVAVSNNPMPSFADHFPQIRFVEADGRALPFPDGSFDIGFSNAVVEHVGSREQQAQFVSELLRVSRRVFISTPNRRHPIDPHTLLPFAHWLPRPRWEWVLRRTNNAQWIGVGRLNPLSEREFLAMFPAASRPRLLRQRLLGLTSVLVVVADGSGQPSSAAR